MAYSIQSLPVNSSFETSLCAQVAQQLRGRIDRLGLKPGDRLGTERDLANEMGVSVRTLREAARQLRTMGLLTSRRGVGLLVTEPNLTENLATALPMYAQSTDNLDELTRLRYVLETGAIRLAVGNVTEAQLAEMEKMADRYHELQEEGRMREADKCEMRFHSLLLEATGSVLVGELHGVIVRFFCATAEYPEIGDVRNPDRSGDHRLICEAIRSGDVDRATRVLEEHLGKMVKVQGKA